MDLQLVFVHGGKHLSWGNLGTARILLPFQLSCRIPTCLLMVGPHFRWLPSLVVTFTDVHPASPNPEGFFAVPLGKQTHSVACQPKYAKITHPGSPWVKLYQLVLC